MKVELYNVVVLSDYLQYERQTFETSVFESLTGG